MSKSVQGNRTYRRGPANTARSTTSVDTNVLLRRADDVGLDTARSAASVDTEVLLGDLASARDVEEPRHLGGGTDGESLNVIDAKSPHLPSSSLVSDEPVNFIGTRSSVVQEAPLDSPYVQSTSLPLSSNAGTVVSNSWFASSKWLTSPLSAVRETPLNATSTWSSSVPEKPLNSIYVQSTSLPTSSFGAEDLLVSTTNGHLTSPLTFQSLPPTSLLSTDTHVNYLAPAQPASLPSSLGQSFVPEEHGSNPAVESTGRFHVGVDRSLVTARSVASAECAPVDYDNDHDDDDAVRFREVDHRGFSGFETSVSAERSMFETRSSVDCPSLCHPGSSGFETPVLDHESDDTFCSVTGRSDVSLDAAMLLRDSTFSPSAAADDFHLPDSGTTSRTAASVDTNVLLQTTEDVVMAMEAARTNQRDLISSRDPSPLFDTSLSHFRHHEEIDMNPLITQDVAVLGADHQTETDDEGKTRELGLPSRGSVPAKPPSAAAGKSQMNSTVNYGRRGAKQAWGNLSNCDISEGVSRYRTKAYGGHKTLQKTFPCSQQRGGGRTVDFSDVGSMESANASLTAELGHSQGDRSHHRVIQCFFLSWDAFETRLFKRPRSRPRPRSLVFEAKAKTRQVAFVAKANATK